MNAETVEAAIRKAAREVLRLERVDIKTWRSSGVSAPTCETWTEGFLHGVEEVARNAGLYRLATVLDRHAERVYLTYHPGMRTWKHVQ